MINKEERENLKLQRRLNAANDFIKNLNEIGGYFNLAEVSKHLSMSYDEVNSLVSKRAILGFSLNSEDIYPKFQFEDNKIIEKYKILLPLFNVDNLTATAFMTTGYVIRNNEYIPYYIAMKDVTDEEFEFIQRDASLYGIHIAR
jgi:hypothetical protein